MDRREIASLAVSFLLSLLAALLALLLFGLGARARASSGLGSQPPSPMEVAVVVNLPEEKAEPGEQKPKQSESAAQGPPPSLASKQEGEPSGQPPKEVETPTGPKSPQEAQAPTEETKRPSEETDLPADTPAKEPEAAAVTAPDASEPSAEALAVEGRLPPFHYIGDTQLLEAQYPRMEMAWILDREPDGPSEPQVLAEIVMGAEGSVYWRNFRLGSKSDYFSEATTWHVLDERVHVSSSSRLRLGRDTARFQRTLREAGLDAVPPSRIRWGYYRHISEAYELGRAVAAFQAGVKSGKVDFQPRRRDYLEIAWEADPQGEPTITQAIFRPEDGSPVPLPLRPAEE